MKLLTIVLIFISIGCFGQSKQEKADTLSTPPVNVIQWESLNAEQAKVNEAQKGFEKLLELIIGHKMEEIVWWGFKEGKFLYVLKPKKK